MNSGLSGFSQTGKFITIYARSDREALDLARQLHATTDQLRGPGIPFDARYRPNSLVYYRYGSFRPTAANANGTISDPAGKSHPDQRAPGRAIPRWLDDPFQRASAKANGGRAAGPLAPDYFPFKVISQRGKGGVYEAIDFSVSPARIVIIKEGRPHGETAWDGLDGFARVKHEARVLRVLRAAGIPVPEIFREFNRDTNRYLVLEKIEGRPLLPRNRTQPARIAWQRAQRFLERLEPVLSGMHAAGWVWRDCKPSHIFLDRGVVRLLDFEGACPIQETEVLAWGSANYLPRVYYESFTRHPGVFEDRHALGVIVFQLGTGKFPPGEKQNRATLYRRTRCPDILREKIDRLLSSKISERSVK
ncbi:MAG TPA: phosphotransferase [Chthoniobacterales bacterium]|nr:phosphotransferase [Chthoniobacterales bacterium]